ncbi:hypothetical protein Poli38472_009023 [Pythium oligandrum]|uniref:Poly(A) RNA polymerase mitochondrial-like central palm domain-containing protein n=1 Tax=Pythium oligandrum TaxID=41045 RepID=A0A8K1CLF1_PYTOL|nr:hypothetical protein Poli38472_009023 [Pythium oligandrum]|eukprot:TMW64856.1 hypothetical protein Poli38472_009023 [Pythium oligandrum]
MKTSSMSPSSINSTSVGVAPVATGSGPSALAALLTSVGHLHHPTTHKAVKSETAKAKKSKQAKQVKQQAASEPVDKAKTTATTKKTVSELPRGPASVKKHPPKQQTFKITRDKERKEKLFKNSAGIAPSESAVASTAAMRGSSNASISVTTSPATALAARLQDLEQDGMKSRNHKLVLAPSRNASSTVHTASTASNGPCWGRLPRSVTSSSSTNSNVTDRLHTEILDYATYTRSTVAEMTVHIEQMITNVRDCVHSLWSKAQIEPYGSYSTGIWLPSSDVDLVILGVVEIHDRTLTVKSLRQLADALRSQSWVESIVVLDTAKIPVLKLVTAESSVPLDITFESTATHSGLLARDLIKRYADEMPELYPLAIVFKQLLRERDLNDAYTGGLSSYSIVLMIIHFQLLWRYDSKCFHAASLFASGAPLPRPADIIAAAKESEGERSTDADSRQSASENITTTEDAKSDATSSYASIVARAKSLKRPASEAGRSAGSAEANKQPTQPFSYAAVAAGIAKLTTESATPAAPTSYAAAVAAPPSATPTRPLKQSGSKSASVDPLDAISVTSSSADTEDSSSSCGASAHDEADDDTTGASSGSANAQHDETPLPTRRVASLGEHTMTILEFFGVIFDYRKNGLSVRDGGYIYRLADHIGTSGDLSKKMPALVLEDPIYPDRNVSASSFAFSKVVAVFEDSYYALKYFRPTRFTPSALSCLLSTSGHTQHQTPQLQSVRKPVVAHTS